MSLTCEDIEQQYGDSQCKCKYYRENFPNCECEASSVSEHLEFPRFRGQLWAYRL